MSDAVIIAKIGGRQRRLSTPKQWRAAIANHDITRVTPITYEPGPGRQADMLAGACPDLVPLFVEILGSRDIPALSSIDEAEVVAIATEEPNQTDGMDVADHPVISSQPDPVAEPEVEPVAVFTDDAEDRSADQDIAYEPPPSTASDMPVGRVIFAIFLTLLLIGAIAYQEDLDQDGDHFLAIVQLEDATTRILDIVLEDGSLKRAVSDTHDHDTLVDLLCALTALPR